MEIQVAELIFFWRTMDSFLMGYKEGKTLISKRTRLLYCPKLWDLPPKKKKKNSSRKGTQKIIKKLMYMEDLYTPLFLNKCLKYYKKNLQ